MRALAGVPERPRFRVVGPAQGLPSSEIKALARDADGYRAYAARLRDSGVPVTYKQFDRQMHNFFAMPGLLPAQAKAVEYVGEQVDRHLAKFSEADAVVVAVAHTDLLARPLDAYFGKITPGGCFIDVKAQFPADTLRKEGLNVWRL